MNHSFNTITTVIEFLGMLAILENVFVTTNFSIDLFQNIIQMNSCLNKPTLNINICQNEVSDIKLKYNHIFAMFVTFCLR